MVITGGSGVVDGVELFVEYELSPLIFTAAI
jgi:hypothetical protein